MSSELSHIYLSGARPECQAAACASFGSFLSHELKTASRKRAPATPVAASDKTDVMAVVHQWVDGFNKGDTKSALAACADDGAIIDDVSPHEWHGSGVCSKWMSAYGAWATKNAITDGKAPPGKVRHIDVDGSSAYVVLPMTLSFKDHDKPMRETGALVTMSLTKGDSGWRITGWSWAAGMTAAASAGSAH